MPGDEWRLWCRYHATEGLPDANLYQAYLRQTIVNAIAGVRRVPLDPFFIRPEAPSPKPDGPAMSPEDAAAYFARLLASRVQDRR